MGRRNLSIHTTVLLLSLCAFLVSKAAVEDINRMECAHAFRNAELVALCELISEHLRSLPNGSLESYSRGQNIRLKRKGIAGLENLDLLSGIFSKLPMRTSAGISDMQALMRDVGKKRK